MKMIFNSSSSNLMQVAHMELIFLQLLPCTCHRSSRSWGVPERPSASSRSISAPYQLRPGSSQTTSAGSALSIPGASGCSPAVTSISRFRCRLTETYGNGRRAPRVAAHSKSTVQAGPETWHASVSTSFNIFRKMIHYLFIMFRQRCAMSRLQTGRERH